MKTAVAATLALLATLQFASAEDAGLPADRYCLLVDRPTLPQAKVDYGVDIIMTFERLSGTDRAGWTWTSGGWTGHGYERGYLLSPDGKLRHEMPELYLDGCSYLGEALVARFNQFEII